MVFFIKIVDTEFFRTFDLIHAREFYPFTRIDSSKEQGDFLEYAEVHGGDLYGTLLHKVVDPIKEGQTVIREFDVQGFLQAQERLPREYYQSIFIHPDGGPEVLVDRIRNRAPISDEDLAYRMESAKKELELAHLYDYIVYSREGKIEEMVEEVEGIVFKGVGSGE